MTGVGVRCLDCGLSGAVNRVTAGLTCGCGSRRIALHQSGREPFMDFMASAHGPGTGWNQKMPDPLSGWSQYAGPMPGPNNMPTPTQNSPWPCQECAGSGYDDLDRGKCRACKGTGNRRAPTSDSPEPQVARHPGQTSKPFMGQRKRAAAPAAEHDNRWEEKPEDGRVFKTPEDVIRHTTPGWATGEGVTTDRVLPNVSPHLKTRNDDAAAAKFSDDALSQRRTQGYPMHDADCPSCGTSPTHLVNDYKGDAWWHCPNCGPLENIDRKPHIDPYNPPTNFKPNPRSFKAGKQAAVVAPGAIFRMLATISSANPGLDQREALGIVRYTVSQYGE